MNVLRRHINVIGDTLLKLKAQSMIYVYTNQHVHATMHMCIQNQLHVLKEVHTYLNPTSNTIEEESLV